MNLSSTPYARMEAGKKTMSNKGANEEEGNSLSPAIAAPKLNLFQQRALKIVSDTHCPRTGAFAFDISRLTDSWAFC